MSVRKLTASLLTALAMLGGVASVHGQDHFQYAPPADPFEFDPDFNWFEPVYDADLIDMKPKKRAATGWFATYDRINLYGSRPELNRSSGFRGDISETALDSGWGYRYELGYMRPGEKHGWMFNWTHNDVGAFYLQGRQERLNRFIAPGGFPVVAPPFGVAVRQEEDNNVGYNFRFYDINDTENLIGYDSYELNKTWRMEPYHYGGILEPMVGLRWMRVDDYNSFANYQSTNDNPPLIIIDGNTGLPFPFVEQLTTSQAKTENEMFGGQVGFRYTKFRHRFTYSGDLRVFFGGAWQESRSQVAREITTYTGNTVGSTVNQIFDERDAPIYTRNEEFFVGFDVRAELGYQLTKMISIRGGFQLIDIARGLWRGGDGSVIEGGDQDQDYLMVGGTFGINLNH